MENPVLGTIGHMEDYMGQARPTRMAGQPNRGEGCVWCGVVGSRIDAMEGTVVIIMGNTTPIAAPTSETRPGKARYLP